MGRYQIISGFNFRMTEMQGAVGLAQLKKLDFILNKQRNNHDKSGITLNRYQVSLKDFIQEEAKYLPTL